MIDIELSWIIWAAMFMCGLCIGRNWDEIRWQIHRRRVAWARCVQCGTRENKRNRERGCYVDQRLDGKSWCSQCWYEHNDIREWRMRPRDGEIVS